MADNVDKQIAILRQLARAGFKPFPLKKSSKLPLHKGWRDRSYRVVDIEIAIRDGNNVGLDLRGGVLVVDVDPRNGGTEGMDLLTLMVDLGKGPRCYSGRGDGGHHIYFTYDKEEWPHLRTKLPLLPGIDFKSNGLVVAPYSIHQATGKPYTPRGDFSQIPEAPEALLALIKAEAPKIALSRSGRVPPEALKYLLNCLDARDYGSGKHDEWFDLMCACHDATAGEGVEEFIEWCASDNTYADEASLATTRNRWHSLSEKEARKTYKTLFRAVVDAGHKDVLMRVEREFEFDDKPEDPSHDFDNAPVEEI